jgi:hypothetical protein
LILVDPVAVALAEDLPTPVAPLQGEAEIEAGKVGNVSTVGRILLFSSQIQSHLETIAAMQRVNDVGMTISNFYQSDSHLYVSVCFEGRGVEGWQMGPATLSFANGEVSWFAVHPTLDQRGSTDGSPGQHCETLEFDDLPAGADLSGLSLRVESVLLAYPEDFKECEVYNARWAKSERMKELGIQVECSLEPGLIQFKLVARPQAMTEEEALAVAGQEAGGMIIGPWVFTEANIVVEK